MTDMSKSSASKITTSGSYAPTQWTETTVNRLSETSKLTKATIVFEFEGSLNAKAFIEYLMFYKSFKEDDPHKSTAQYTGYWRLEGKLKDLAGEERSGSCVIEDHGTFENGEARSKLKVVADTGTEGFKNIRGQGHYTADASGCRYSFDFDFEK